MIAELVQYLKIHYGFDIVTITQLYLGADFHTLTYAVTTATDSYFVKLRKQAFFSKASVLVADYCAAQSLSAIIRPIPPVKHQLYGLCAGHVVIVYPFINGATAAATGLSDKQWQRLGSLMRHMHGIKLPSHLSALLPQEQWDMALLDCIKSCMKDLDQKPILHPVHATTCLFLQLKRPEILTMVKDVEKLSVLVKGQHDFVLCHGDLHGWNIVVNESQDLFIVDFDTLMMAPKERDLMFVGAGIWHSGLSVKDEQAFFYQGYGNQSKVDYATVAWYRLCRILQDIDEYVHHIFSSTDDASLMQSFDYLQLNFSLGNTIDQAYKGLDFL